MAFCDFCTCSDCQNGCSWSYHAPVADGRWICDVCWMYEVCLAAPERRRKGPCDGPCEHRPPLAGPWVDLNGDEPKGAA